ncbi:MAG: hypothetical protein ACOC6G_03275, partial [Thermoproteota archaeon]
MPQRVVCGECGYVLYEGEDLKTPSEILDQYDGECPECHHKLSLAPSDVEVKPIKRYKNAFSH